jgi:hypothetical protein
LVDWLSRALARQFAKARQASFGIGKRDRERFIAIFRGPILSEFLQ